GREPAHRQMHAAAGDRRRRRRRDCRTLLRGVLDRNRLAGLIVEIAALEILLPRVARCTELIAGGGTVIARRTVQREIARQHGTADEEGLAGTWSGEGGIDGPFRKRLRAAAGRRKCCEWRRVAGRGARRTSLITEQRPLGQGPTADYAQRTPGQRAILEQLPSAPSRIRSGIA